MLRVRLLLAWLIMAALPLQGIAAASMLHCGSSHHLAAGAKPAEPARPAASAADHEHSQHSHASAVQAGKAGDTANSLPDAAHKCGVCASCCHSLAIAGIEAWPQFAALPQAESAEPFVLIHAPPWQLPDKPPRA